MVSRVRNSKDFQSKLKKVQSIEKKASKARENISRFEKRKQIKKQQIEKLKNETGTVFSNEKEDVANNSESLSRNLGIEPNHLHFFASYSTLFTLSGLNEDELKNPILFLNNPVHDVIARSAGIGDPNVNRDVVNNLATAGPQISIKDRENKEYEDSIRILKQGRDIFFEEVNLLSTCAPSEERGMADFVKMEFKLHEPFGISFIEKVRACARLNGYKDHLDAPMLLTIEFKGYDEKGQAFSPSQAMIRKIPILITKVDLDVNEGGAIYDVTAVRIQDLAFDDRFKFPRTAFDFTATSLQVAVDRIAEKLNEQIAKEKNEHKVREVEDKYIIDLDPDIVALAKDYSALAKSGHNFQKPETNDPRDNRKTRIGNRITVDVAEGTVTNLISLTKILEDVVRSTTGFESITADFWTAYLRRVGFIEPGQEADSKKIKEFYESGEFEQKITENAFVPWFKIKTSVATDYSQFDNINKMHRKIITYKIIPHYIPVLKFIRPGMFAKKGAMRNAIKKQYNYIYTGKNVDVQSLRINYKTAYYQRNTIEVGKPNENVLEKLEKIVTRILPREDIENKDITTLRGYPSVVKGRNILNKGAEDQGIEGRKQEFFDYLTNPQVDMMRVELEILGDPAYICQDQFIPLDGQGNQTSSRERFSSNTRSFNVDNYSPLIEIIYSLPDDIDEKKEGLMFRGTEVPEQNLFFAGVYQVVRIESSFSNGQFIQNLTCVRLNNQSGLGEDVQKITFNASDKFLKSLVADKVGDVKKDAENLIAKTLDQAIGPFVP